MPRFFRLTQAGLLGMAIAMLVAPQLPAQAQFPYPPENTITTHGQGEVRVKPDSLNVTVSVESRATELNKARAENNRKMQAVTSALKALNIPNMTLETTGVQIYPVQGEYGRNQLPKVVGYQATNSLTVTVRRVNRENLAEYGSRIMDAALDAGANNVGGLGFFLDDMAAAKTQALQEAVNDARRNATAMAQAAGVTLSGVYSIEGEPQFGGYPRPVPMMAAREADQAGAPSVPVEAGETTVSSRVVIRYRF